MPKKSPRLIISILAAFFISAVTEIAQYVTQRGLFEFDDIFDNTMGAVIGVVVYCGLVKMCDLIGTVCRMISSSVQTIESVERSVKR